MDHPSNSIRGGVCVYLKDCLPMIARNDLPVMEECLVTEISVDNEKWLFTRFYRSPSQSHEELDAFCSN